MSRVGRYWWEKVWFLAMFCCMWEGGRGKGFALVNEFGWGSIFFWVGA